MNNLFILYQILHMDPLRCLYKHGLPFSINNANESEFLLSLVLFMAYHCCTADGQDMLTFSKNKKLTLMR